MVRTATRHERRRAGILLVAIAGLTGGALVLGAAIYARAHAPVPLFALLAGPLLLGAGVFLVLGITRYANRAESPYQSSGIYGTRQSIHRSGRRPGGRGF